MGLFGGGAQPQNAAFVSILVTSDKNRKNDMKALADYEDIIDSEIGPGRCPS